MSHGVHRGILKKGKVDDREKMLTKLSKTKKLILIFMDLITNSLFGVMNSN